MTKIAIPRRAFLFGVAGAASLIAAPKLIVSTIPVLWGDGHHDDTDAFQALIDGLPVKLPSGETFRSRFSDSSPICLHGGVYRISRTLELRTPRVQLTNLSLRHSGSGPALRVDRRAVEGMAFGIHVGPA